MRFRFKGFGRDTGKPLSGHLEAADAEAAYQLLSERGIVTESLQGDPDSSASSDTPDVQLFENSLDEALNSALDASSKRVSFDALTKYYRGKKVRVIDRDKIRQQVAEVVDSTLLASELLGANSSTARERVAEAIRGLFQNSQNVTSPPPVAQPTPANGASGPDLSNQIGKLSDVVQQAERMIAAMQSALRNVESGGAGPRRSVSSNASLQFNPEQNAVLREILESNLELRRVIEQQTS